jgi:hypothetical protein
MRGMPRLTSESRKHAGQKAVQHESISANLQHMPGNIHAVARLVVDREVNEVADRRGNQREHHGVLEIIQPPGTFAVVPRRRQGEKQRRNHLGRAVDDQARIVCRTQGNEQEKEEADHGPTGDYRKNQPFFGGARHGPLFPGEQAR